MFKFNVDLRHYSDETQKVYHAPRTRINYWTISTNVNTNNYAEIYLFKCNVNFY